MQNFKPCIDVLFEAPVFNTGGRLLANVLTGSTVYAVSAVVDLAGQILSIQEIGETLACCQ